MKRTNVLLGFLLAAIVLAIPLVAQNPGVGVFSRLMFRDGNINGPHERWGSGDPNGVSSAPMGSTYRRTEDGTFWTNTDGGTVWTQVGGGSGGGSFAYLGEYIASASATLDAVTRNAPGKSGAIFQSDYDDYVIRFLNIFPSTSAQDLDMRVTTDGGSTWESGTNYFGLIGGTVYGGGDFATSYGSNTAGHVTLWATGSEGVSTADGTGFSGEMSVFNPLGSTHKSFMHEGPVRTTNWLAMIWRAGISVNITTPINGVQFYATAGNINGTVRIYALEK